MLTSWWRHAGLQQPEMMTTWRFTNYQKMLKTKIFVKDWHEPVQINLGPNVGDITTGREPAYLGRVNFISSIKVIKPSWQMKAQGL